MADLPRPDFLELPVADVEAARSHVTAMVEELEQVERALIRGAEDPYR